MALSEHVFRVGQRFEVNGVVYVVTYLNQGKGRFSVEPVGLRRDLVVNVCGCGAMEGEMHREGCSVMAEEFARYAEMEPEATV